jgi:hypothetical protein
LVEVFIFLSCYLQGLTATVWSTENVNYGTYARARCDAVVDDCRPVGAVELGLALHTRLEAAVGGVRERCEGEEEEGGEEGSDGWKTHFAESWCLVAMILREKRIWQA